jgi:hypothetical protein
VIAAVVFGLVAPAQPAPQVQVTVFQWCSRFQYTGEPVSRDGEADLAAYNEYLRTLS